MRLFDAHLSLPDEARPPDQWKDSYENTLKLESVISRDRDGNVVSIVGDFAWDWTPYDPNGQRSSIYFYYWLKPKTTVDPSEVTPLRIARIRELQYLMVRLIYRESGQLLGGRTLRQNLGVLCHIARLAESRSCSIRDILISRDNLDALIQIVPGTAAQGLIAWLGFLAKIEEEGRLGYLVAKPRRLRQLQEKAKEYQQSLKQHAAIPSRIYASIINELSSELDDIEDHKERLISALRASITEREYDRKDADGHLGPALVKRYGLEKYFSRRGFTYSMKGLSAAVTDIFRVCKLQIHTFTGMRDGEARHLPFYCMATERRAHGRNHSLVVGVTTKLEGGRARRAKWVTTDRDGFRAIRLAQQFASIIYGSIGVTPSESEKLKDKYPLFISTQYLPWLVAKSEGASGKFIVSPGTLSGASKHLLEKLKPIIQEVDVAELEQIDAFRSWRDEEEYAVGQAWSLKPHQLRRSLALYANASGLVRLSSLRRQLQHITREMSLYYARGSAFAINFVAEDPKGYKQHMAVVWQEGGQEAEYLAFIKDVLESDEPMYGPAGTYYELKKKRNEYFSPEELKKQIKMGRLSYRSTPLGGCTNPNPCESVKGLRLIDSACATEGCKNLVGKHSKIIELVRLQRGVLNRIDPKSIAYQMEKEELDALIAVEVLWRPPGESSEVKKGSEYVRHAQ
jgi:RNA polymerase-interacting CarD/CdnL/TRCF family regulator